jgi:NAD+--asparagine ADP-ribosyltransferase
MCRGKFESNFSIVKKMSQNNTRKKAVQDEQNKGYFYGTITNIEQTLERFLQREIQDAFRLGYKMSDDIVKNSYEVKLLEEIFTKGYLTAKIITSRLDETNKTKSVLARLAIMGTLSKEVEEMRDKILIPALVVRSGTPISDISGRDLPSPAEI